MRFPATLTAATTTSTWTGAGGNNWSTPTNWNPVGTPANDGTATIALAGSTRTSPIVDVPWSIDGLKFNTVTSGFTLGGSTLTIGAGGITNLSSSHQTINNSIVLAADQTWVTGTNSTVELFTWGTLETNGHALTIGGTSAHALFNAALTGSGSLTIDMPQFSSATVASYGNNTYTGGTFLNRGTLFIDGDESLGAPSSPVVFNGGQLTVGNSITVAHDITVNSGGGTLGVGGTNVTVSSNIQGAGALKIKGSGRVTLKGSNTYAGGTAVDGLELIGSTTSLQGDISLADLHSLVQFEQTFNGVYSGNISGNASLVKRGTGTVAFTGNITVSSTTRVEQGVLEIAAGSGGLSPTSFLALNGGTIQFVGPTTFTRGLDMVGWSATGGLSARDGNLTINIGGNGALFDYRSAVPVGGMSFGSASSNAATEFQNPILLGPIGFTGSPRVIQVNQGVGGDYTLLSGTISGTFPLAKTGKGLLKLTAANTFSGGLILGDGATQASEGIGLPSASPLELGGGVWMSEGPATFSRGLGSGAGQVRWTGSGGFAAEGGALTVNIGGTAGLQTWGVGGFVPTGSALILGNARANARTNFVNPIALGTAVREIRVEAGLGGDSASIAGALSGAGGINKTGSGILRLTGTSSYTGATTLTAGTLVVDGLLAKTAITVSGGATVGGTGSIGGSILAAGGSGLSSRATIGVPDGMAGTLILSDPSISGAVLTVGGASDGAPSAFDFEVGSSADLISLFAGKFQVNPGGATINVVPLSGFGPGTYDLIAFRANQASGLDRLKLSEWYVGGYVLSLQSTPTAEQLVVSVPEPSTAGVCAVAVTMAGVIKRRRPLARKRE